jgi:ABC-2 type transport system ATP-binding protein
MLAVDVKNIKKTFISKQDTVEAVKDVSFQVKQGEIFGLLGPNGAGKSTTILMLTTLLSITDGRASVLGIDVSTKDKEVREKIGVALQDTGIDNLLTGKELFFTTCRLWGYSKKDSDRRVKTYSGGMKRRLDLGLSLVHSPEILFLDEPTTGLDPGSRRVLWDEIKRLRDNGVTIILTTQYLEEADELADRIAIIDEGLVVAEGTSDELKAGIGGDVITFAFENNNDLENAKNILKNTVQEKNELRITVEDGASKIPGYLKDLSSNGVEVSSVSASKPTLDDVFLEVTGYRLEGSEDITNNEEKSER